MITEFPSAIYTDENKFSELLNAKSALPPNLNEKIKQKCSYLILVDEILHSKNKHPQAKKTAMQLLQMEHHENLTISPSNLSRNDMFFEKMLMEAGKSSSRYALEFLTSLHKLIDELLLNPYISQTNNALATFIRCFQKFSRHYLETKLFMDFP
jgi:hypothetical protein